MIKALSLVVLAVLASFCVFAMILDWYESNSELFGFKQEYFGEDDEEDDELD